MPRQGGLRAGVGGAVSTSRTSQPTQDPPPQHPRQHKPISDAEPFGAAPYPAFYRAPPYGDVDENERGGPGPDATSSGSTRTEENGPRRASFRLPRCALLLEAIEGRVEFDSVEFVGRQERRVNAAGPPAQVHYRPSAIETANAVVLTIYRVRQTYGDLRDGDVSRVSRNFVSDASHECAAGSTGFAYRPTRFSMRLPAYPLNGVDERTAVRIDISGVPCTRNQVRCPTGLGTTARRKNESMRERQHEQNVGPGVQ